MEENNILENLNQSELIQINNASKIQKNKIITIIASLLLICILFLSYFLFRNEEVINLVDENKKGVKEIFTDKLENICEIGEEEKCLECDSTKNICSSCNPGYKLENGKCILNYSFKATYYSNSDNKNITLINSTYVQDIIEISLNNISIPVSQNYTFPTAGNYTLYFLMKNPSTNSLSKMFRRIDNITSISFTRKYNTENITDISYMFDYCSSINSINLSNFNTKNVINMNMLFSSCKKLISVDLSNFNTKNTKDMSRMFSYCSSLTSIDFSSFDISNVINMAYMFESCYSLISVDISNFDTGKVQDMTGMFYGSEMKKIDLSNFNTNNVKYMNEMFYWSIINEIDVSHFDTSNVVDMSTMFFRCYQLASIDLSSFNTKNVRDMNDMFFGCESLIICL